MFNLLAKVPAKERKKVSQGLFLAAPLVFFFGLLSLQVYAVATEEKCEGHLFWRDCVDVAVPMSTRLTNLFIGVGLLAIAVGLLIAALRLVTSGNSFNQYQAILTGEERIGIEKVAAITRSRPSRVREDLQSMIDSEMITDYYIDYAADCVVSKKFTPKTSHKTVVKCTECGGNNELIVGITRVCGFCGQALVWGPPQPPPL
jgi:hypothetical protein